MSSWSPGHVRSTEALPLPRRFHVKPAATLATKRRHPVCSTTSSAVPICSPSDHANFRVTGGDAALVPHSRAHRIDRCCRSGHFPRPRWRGPPGPQESGPVAARKERLAVSRGTSGRPRLIAPTRHRRHLRSAPSVLVQERGLTPHTGHSSSGIGIRAVCPDTPGRRPDHGPDSTRIGATEPC